MFFETGVEEKRKFTRRPLHGVVSFACSEDAEMDVWYLGWIQDTSVAGMKIFSQQPGTVRVGNLVTVLCLPGSDQKSRGKESVRIQAEVVWQSEDGFCFGIRFC